MASKTLLLTGATGLIGRALVRELKNRGHHTRILTRSARKEPGYYTWNPDEGKLDTEALHGVDVLVHLAGAGIADKRWTPARKEEIITSRTQGMDLLHQNFERLGNWPSQVVSASGINYYGTHTSETVYAEHHPPGTDFLSEVCLQWEAAAHQFDAHCKVACLRTAVVFTNRGGALQKLAAPVKFGVGSALGSGKQWMPWIHIADLVSLYVQAIEQGWEGNFNASHPEYLTNAHCIRLLGEVMNKPIWAPNVPAFALKLLLGEMAAVVLEGSRADATKVLQKGFAFQFGTAREALSDLYSGKKS